jgi:hypothetical protein
VDKEVKELAEQLEAQGWRIEYQQPTPWRARPTRPSGASHCPTRPGVAAGSRTWSRHSAAPAPSSEEPVVSEDGWTVHVEARVHERVPISDVALEGFLNELEEHGGSVSVGDAGYGAMFSLYANEAENVEDACGAGIQAFLAWATHAGMPDGVIERVEVMTFREHDAELAERNFPDLVGVSEIATILGVSRQRAHQLTKRADFPAAVAELAAGPVWTRLSLNRFVDAWRAGKPDDAPELIEIEEALESLEYARNRVKNGQPINRNEIVELLMNNARLIEDLQRREFPGADIAWRPVLVEWMRDGTVADEQTIVWLGKMLKDYPNEGSVHSRASIAAREYVSAASEAPGDRDSRKANVARAYDIAPEPGFTVLQAVEAYLANNRVG